MCNRIPLSVPSIQGNEWKYIKECLDTEWVSSAGKYVDHFEQKICEFTGAKYAIACVNGTAALQVALRLVGVQQGDEVLVPTLTFIAPVNAISYNNAVPLFMDADDYYNIDVEKTIEFIKNEAWFKNGYTYNKTTNKRITAIIPVHIFGNAVTTRDSRITVLEYFKQFRISCTVGWFLVVHFHKTLIYSPVAPGLKHFRVSPGTESHCGIAFDKDIVFNSDVSSAVCRKSPVRIIYNISINPDTTDRQVKIDRHTAKMSGTVNMMKVIVPYNIPTIGPIGITADCRDIPCFQCNMVNFI